jgi:hypothetical protein
VTADAARVAAVLALAAAAGAAWRAAPLFFPGLFPGLLPRRWRIAGRRGRPRPPVSRRLRRALLVADRRCVHCGRRDDLQLDHVRPWPGYSDARAARAILRAERIRRGSPLRWARLLGRR